MKLNKEILDKYVEEGWLISQNHPELPLSIYNYSQSTQYEGHWDEVTLSCRGVIVDNETGEVIVKPFSKFFNYEEVSNEVPWMSSDYIYLQEKMDGSLGILFWYKDRWIMSTRGSFTSEQAIRGMEILKSKYSVFDQTFERSVAYICEIIYPENRIVVNYNKEKIVFLGATINWTFTGWKESEESELHWTMAEAYFRMSGIRKEDIVKTEQIFKHDLGHELYKKLKSQNTPNKEGYVLRFFPSNTRVKIKFEDYVILHRILTNVSSYDIWENLMEFNKLPEQMLKDVPDEFYEWVRGTEDKVKYNFDCFYNLYMGLTSSVIRYGGLDRKQIAERVLKIKDVNHSIIFDIIDGKDPSNKIWKLVKPEYEKPFAKELI